MTRPILSYKFLALALSLFQASLVVGQSDNSSSDVADSQYWHERYHGILSMAAYGDYATLCPLHTFTQASLNKAYPDSTEVPWTLVQQWGPTASGLQGYIATIPEMDKVVMVFQGIYGWQEQWNQTTVNLNDIFYLNCPNCTAHAGAVQAYLEAKEATNDWAMMQTAVNASGHQWSITGHAFGGMVAQVAALDLGWRGLSHWSHSHGSPRVFNAASANLYNSLYEGQAGQRCVANNDSLPTVIPESDDYTHTLQGFYVYGSNVTYGQNYDICTMEDDPNCLGGDIETDTWYYYSDVGTCDGDTTYNSANNTIAESSISSAYFATATVAPSAVNAIQTITITSTSTSSQSTSTSSTSTSSSPSTTPSTSSYFSFTTSSNSQRHNHAQTEVANGAENAAVTSISSPTNIANGAATRSVAWGFGALVFGILGGIFRL